MNQIQEIFRYHGHEVRLIVKGGQPWWVLNDVCKILDLSNPRMVAARLKDKRKGVSTIDTPGGKQTMLVVNEPGLYDVIFQSRKPEAEQFKDWVFEEVLPQIRRTGQFNAFADRIPKTYPEALRALADAEEEKARLQEENQYLKPKAEQHDLFLSGQNAQSVSQVAKSFGWGRNRLFEFLREKKILMTRGSDHNLPYQQYIDRGYFKIKESQVAIGDEVKNVTTTLVTARGIEYIWRLLKEEGLLEEIKSGA